MLTESQRKAAEALFGPALLAQIISDAEAQSKALEESGIAYKSRVPSRTKADLPPEQPKIDAELLDKIVQAVIAKLEAGPMMEKVSGLVSRLEELEQAVDGVEKSARAKAAVEMPRFWHSLADVQPPAGKKEPLATGAAAYFTGPPRVNGNNPFYNGGEK